MLFAFGDCSAWLVTTPDAVSVSGYEYVGRAVMSIKSSGNPEQHQVRWGDWWISVQNSSSDSGPSILYGQGNFGGNLAHLEEGKNTHGGANVYIRESAGGH